MPLHDQILKNFILRSRYGLSNLCNPALASRAFHLLPYRGLGSGIPRATDAWPDIALIDDRRPKDTLFTQ